MLKKGFTLQELLISLAVIGIVSALALPAIMNMQPDKNKSMYIKAYNTLAVQTAEILDDSSLYWNTYNDAGEVDKSGLYSDVQPTVSPYNSDEHCKGATKFPAILSHRLNLNGDATYDNNTVNFTTTDGVEWSFETSASNEDGKSVYLTTVTINVNPTDEAHACTYSDNCTKPSQFMFQIGNDGDITPTDAMGIAYLQNPTDMHATSDDSAVAEKVYKNNKPLLDKIDKIDGIGGTIRPGGTKIPLVNGTTTGTKIDSFK